jgi:hypothetical protein
MQVKIKPKNLGVEKQNLPVALEPYHHKDAGHAVVLLGKNP